MRRTWVLVLFVGGCALIGSVIAIPFISLHVQRGERVELGEMNHMTIYATLGNIALPNAGGSGMINERTPRWDAYLTSAPVPDVRRTGEGLLLSVPWTRLPTSIISTIQQVDPDFANGVHEWLFLHQGPHTWKFAQVSRLPVTYGHYRAFTGVNSIYGVNLFDFLGDLKSSYRESLRAAVRDAAKFTVQEAGKNGDQHVAFPAIAGAAMVTERELVLSYSDSFDSLLDGVARAQNATPADVTLVVWDALTARPVELKAALDGLDHAAYGRVTSLKARVVTTATIAASLALVVGVLFSFYRRPHNEKLAIVITSAAATAVAAAQYKLLTASAELLPISGFPPLDITVLAIAAAIVGTILERVGNLAAVPKQQ